MSFGDNADWWSPAMKLRPVALPKIKTANLPPYGEPSEERERNEILYHPDKLNQGQRRIFDYVHANPDSKIIIDAGSGTGKSFTLMTIARSWSRPVYAIFCKHDSLHPYRHIAHRYTVAIFFMDLLRIDFNQYRGIERELSGKMSGFQFISCMVALLARARMPDMKNSLVLIDDYTVIPKPLLVLILTLLKYYKIGAIICGDKNQLQNYHNSIHAQCSSFELASMMRVDKIFTLYTNERCSNTTYNSIMEYISGFSSDKPIDDFACALTAAIFPRQLGGNTTFSDTHIAATHRNLTKEARVLVERDAIPQSFYSSTMNNRNDNNFSGVDKKFLSYVPLAIGTKYLVGKRTETLHAVLECIKIDRLGIPQSLRLRCESSQRIIHVEKGEDHAIFDDHRSYFRCDKIYNFPIYPANLMTFHKCIGHTIENNLDISLMCEYGTYQGLYVALTRVRDPKQIVRVLIPNLVSHQVSTIVNFEEHSRGEEISAEILESRMNNYAFYDVRDKRYFEGLVNLFFESSCGAARLAIRDKIISAVKSEPPSLMQPPRPSHTGKSHVIKTFIEHMDIFLALSQIGKIERNVWLHEFVDVSPDMVLLRNDVNESTEHDKPTLQAVAGFNNFYSMASSTEEYMESIDHETESRFLTNVYKQLTSSCVTRDWLIEQLNESTYACHADINIEPVE